MLTYRAGFGHYDTERRRDETGSWVEQVLPAEPGPTHAFWGRLRYRQTPPRRRQVEFYSAAEYGRALCGATIKVGLPLTFDPGDPDACQSCAGHAHNDTRVSPK